MDSVFALVPQRRILHVNIQLKKGSLPVPPLRNAHVAAADGLPPDVGHPLHGPRNNM